MAAFEIASLAWFRGFVLPSNPLLLAVTVGGGAWLLLDVGPGPRWLVFYALVATGLVCPLFALDHVTRAGTMVDYGARVFALHVAVHALLLLTYLAAWRVWTVRRHRGELGSGPRGASSGGGAAT